MLYNKYPLYAGDEQICACKYTARTNSVQTVLNVFIVNSVSLYRVRVCTTKNKLKLRSIKSNIPIICVITI